MIRVLLKEQLPDEQIPVEACSINFVMFNGENRMALYFRALPVPTSILPENIVDLYDTEA